MTENNTVLDRSDTSSENVEELRMLIRTPQGQSKLYIVVEGEDDVRIYKRFFNDKTTDFMQAGNCMKVLETMQEVANDGELKKQVVGIKDADFDHIKGVTYRENCPMLFLTDTHDIETMILTRNVMRKLCIEMIMKYDDSIFNQAIDVLVPYSYLRYYNDVFKLEICFGKQFNLSRRYREAGCKDLKFWYDAVKSCNNNGPKCPNFSDLSDYVVKHSISEDDDTKLKFVNGHELLQIIRDIFHHKYPNTRTRSLKEFETSVRSAYSFEDFKKTKLYDSLKSWTENLDVIDVWMKSNS